MNPCLVWSGIALFQFSLTDIAGHDGATLQRDSHVKPRPAPWLHTRKSNDDENERSQEKWISTRGLHPFCVEIVTPSGHAPPRKDLCFITIYVWVPILLFRKISRYNLRYFILSQNSRSDTGMQKRSVIMVETYLFYHSRGLERISLLTKLQACSFLSWFWYCMKRAFCTYLNFDFSPENLLESTDELFTSDVGTSMTRERCCH